MTDDEQPTSVADAPLLPTTELGPPPEIPTPLAYSDALPQVVEAAPSRRRSILLAALVAVLAVVVLVGMYVLGRTTDDIAAPVSVAAPALSSSSAPPTPAQGSDDIFFALMARYKLGYGTRQDAINSARTTCRSLNDGMTYGSLQTALIDASGGDGARKWTVRDADQFLDASIEAYCPVYRDLVPQDSLDMSKDPWESQTSAPAPAAAPNASSSSELADARFLKSLDSAGVGYTNRAGQIGQGRQVCAALDGGESYAALLDEMSGTAWSARIIRAAVESYCPENGGMLP